MKHFRGRHNIVGLLRFALIAWVATRSVYARPTIEHDPVKVAIQGQSVSVLARVRDKAAEVKSVTLFYSVSKDVAPFRVVMQASDTGVYYGTIPAEHFEKALTLFYYIEAANLAEETTETPWYTIPVRTAAQVQRGVAAASPTPSPTAPPAEEKESTIRWGTIGLIAGGAAAVVGGAFLLGGGGDTGDESSEGVQPGDYDGSVTECFTPDGGSPDCSTHAMSIRIETDGKVSSSTLREGVVMESVLRGNRFTLTASLNNPTSGVGQVEYSGTVASDTIVGTISGEAMTPLGTGVFSGTFSATKRP